MCGIAGFSGSFSQDELLAMREIIAHRGPDDAGIWMGQGAGLAHRRLAVIDTSPAGHQPMASNGGHVIAYNGEIYNFRELRAKLEAHGRRFRSHSDTEVLLQAWEEFGEECLGMLNGMYAFALWDAKSRTLLLARDPVGIKPLYLTQTPRGIAFASELKALLLLKDVDTTLDPTAVHATLSYLWTPNPMTMIQGVRKVSPGEALLIRDGNITRCWRFAPPMMAEPEQDISAADAAAAVRAALRRAVERQLVADVPVGTFLSGGLDSSVVAAIAAESVQLPCFTVSKTASDLSGEGFAEDLPYARQVAAHLQLPLHEVETKLPDVGDLEHMIWHLDEPQADPAALHVGSICREARKHGVKVLLNGTGGDDVFTGYRRHAALMAERWWGWWPRLLRKMLADAASALPAGRPWGRRMGRMFRFADCRPQERLVGYFHWLGREQWDLYGPVLKDAVPRGSFFTIATSLAELPENVHPLRAMLHLEQRHFLPDHNLNYTDKMSMAHGIETRVPLLDQDLMRLAATLPVRLLQRGREGKWILRQAVKGLVPDAILRRPKTGFAAPLRHWLQGPLKSLSEDVLSQQAIRSRGLFNAAAVERLRRMDRAGRVDAAYPLFSMMVIEMWCRVFLDRRRTVGHGG